MKVWQVVIVFCLTSSEVRSQEHSGLIDTLINAIDNNKNNNIDHDEIAEFFVGRKKGSVEIADKLVKMIDQNGDNEANKEELMKAAKKIVEFYIDTFDLNNDGALSQEEFVGNAVDVKGSVKNVEMVVGLLVQLIDVNKERVNSNGDNVGLHSAENSDDFDMCVDLDDSGCEHPEQFKTLEVFKEALDKNRDGKFSKEEIKSFANIAVNLFDVNKDGKIAKEEVFKTLERNYLPKKKVTVLRSESNDKTVMDAWRDVFENIDDRNNKDGKLEAEEIVPLLDTPIVQLFSQLGEKMAPLSASLQKDSQITSEELVKSLKYFLQNKQFTSSANLVANPANIALVISILVFSFL